MVTGLACLWILPSLVSSFLLIHHLFHLFFNKTPYFLFLWQFKLVCQVVRMWPMLFVIRQAVSAELKKAYGSAVIWQTASAKSPDKSNRIACIDAMIWSESGGRSCRNCLAFLPRTSHVIFLPFSPQNHADQRRPLMPTTPVKWPSNFTGQARRHDPRRALRPDSRQIA